MIRKIEEVLDYALHFSEDNAIRISYWDVLTIKEYLSTVRQLDIIYKEEILRLRHAAPECCKLL